MFFAKKSKSKKAFTVAELLIVIGIISVLALIITPIMVQTIPSKEEKMHQKISYMIEQLVSHLYDNEAYYPKTLDVAKLGFKNTDEVNVDGIRYGGGAANSLARKQKFCHLFAHQFANVNHGSVTCPDNIDSGNPSFRSADGVDWWIPKTTFEETTNGQFKGFVKIKIDVNGSDKGQNCTEGSNGCKKPDTFYYYIKTNGTVTLSNPVSVNESSYEILPQITTKDVNGNDIGDVVLGNVATGGTVEIATMSEDGSIGTFSSYSTDFDNLSINENYMLRAKPNNGYISNWGTKNTNNEAEKRYGYKRIHISKLKTNVPVEFKQVQTYCIKVKVTCPFDDISDCVSTKQYKYNCKYTNVGQGNGDYERPNANLDGFNFVGAGKGSYTYSCSNTGTLTVGSEETGDAGYLKACGLQTGDYQFYITPANDLHIFPEIKSYYLQNVRLGTNDIDDFEVEIRN